MRLEILVTDGDVQIYPLNRPKIIVGTGDVCDIVVDASGVSRKHVFILTENDQYFVVDQGSTNGTFINEERLQPGKKVEFTSFFPVRLGENVLITLLSDEESSDLVFSDFNSPKKEVTSPSIKTPDKSDMTRTLSLNELSTVKTQALVKKRKELQSARAMPKKAPATKDKSRMIIVKIGIVILMLSAAYYNLFIREKEPEDVNIAKVGEVLKEVPVEEVKVKVPLISNADLVSHEKLLLLLKDFKCVSDFEKFLCDKVKGARENSFGVVQVGLMLNIFVDATSYFVDAKNHVPLPRDKTPDLIEKYEKDVKETAIASFIVYAIPDTLDFDHIKDFGLTITLVTPAHDKVEIAAAIAPGAIKTIKEQLKEKALFNERAVGIKALEFTRELYRVY